MDGNGESKEQASGKGEDVIKAKAPDGVDYANYFCAYAELYHQKQMLVDSVRMEQYMQAILGNKSSFKNKIVLDIGAGTGILSIWAAKAGALRVYAIEATEMAVYARRLVKANGLGNVIKVIQGKAEEVKLEEKADIIISEWMGCFLLRESMLDTVIWARDNLMKKGGALYPSHARIVMAAIQDPDRRIEAKKLQNSNDRKEWAQFLKIAQKKYDVNMDILTGSYHKELDDYYFNTAICLNLYPKQVLAESSVIEWDLHNITMKQLKDDKIANFNLVFSYDGTFSGLGGWFDVDFKGSKALPAKNPVILSTSPSVGYTHWGQQAFLIPQPTKAMKGDTLSVKMRITRQKKNDRMIDVHLAMAGKIGNQKEDFSRPLTLYHVE